MKFNKKTKSKDKVVNYEGATAYKITPELELYSAVCTASLSDKFYEKSEDYLDRIRILIKHCDPKFVAKLAIYAREKMYLRSIPLVLAVELAKIHKGDKLISILTHRIIQRADEIPEILSYYVQSNKRKDIKKLNKLSKQIKIGVANAFHKFDAYQFGKYNRDSEIKLRDALFLTHPKPVDKDEEKLFKQIVDNTLPIPYTWEVELSKSGKEEKDKKVVWEQLIDSNKLGYMAILRNLRNMLDANISNGHIHLVAAKLANKMEVEKSRQLPFRFLSAYKELEYNDNKYTSDILDALEDAAIASASNIQGFDSKTGVLIACDVSGSMQQPLNPKSKVQYFDIGLVLGMLLQHKCYNVITGIFGDAWKVKQMSKKSILQNVMKMYHNEGEVGYSTNGHLVIDYLINEKIIMDKIMIFTDCQLWNSNNSLLRNNFWGNRVSDGSMRESWQKYKTIAPKAKLYLFDMAGYGNTPVQINNVDVTMIAGWSDKIFDMLTAIEKGSNAIAEINAIDIISSNFIKEKGESDV
jgi:60 kDa SS-A/Ro ribonucleoprotein